MKSCKNYLAMSLICCSDIWRLLLVVLAACTAACASHDIVQTFSDPVFSSKILFNHLVVDRNTGRVYVGGVNRIYELSPDLEVTQSIVTGPVNDSASCSFDCPRSYTKKPTDNINKVLVIDYPASRLITCGSVQQGLCSVRNLNNISHDVREVREPVAANDVASSTVAFIAPGPPNPLKTQVMYVGVTFTGNSPHRSEVPAVSSRSLEDDRLLMIAVTSVTAGTRMFVSSLSRESYRINYVYGFSSEVFSYFLTTQLRGVGSNSYYSKLVRVCHDDHNYYSYTEIPMSCNGGYNLVQAAFVGKAGPALAGELGITTQDDVLFAAFSQSESINTSTPTNLSALCVYSLKAIRRKFMQNIKTCFNGNGSRGLDFISPSHTCIGTKLQSISEDFCGLDVNTPLGGEQPVEAIPVAVFSERLTAVAATATGDYTVVFAGTAEGHLKKIVVESATSAFEYEDIVIDNGSPVRKDLVFDTQLMHLYVMTERKVSKVKVQKCNVYKNCLTCVLAKDPYCGWCSIENKCSLHSDCQEAAKDPLYWISYRSGRCTTITQVTPNKIQRTTARTLDIVIENLPTPNDQLLCEFKALNRSLITNATRRPYGVNCTTPRTDTLPPTPASQHHFTAKLSVRTTQGPDLVTTNFTFYDCSTYSSCTQCVSSSSPCDWCVDGHRCTHDTAENCRNDILVTGVSRIAPSYRSGPRFCPTIESTSDGTNEIIVPSGVKKAIKVKVHIIGQFIVLTRFVCQFNIEGQVTSVNAQLLADNIYCDAVEFTYTSQAPNITVSFAVIWGGSKALDNPNNTHVLIYRCNDMANDCGKCLVLPEKFGCGWCSLDNKCSLRSDCKDETKDPLWISYNSERCPSTIIQVTPNKIQRTTAKTLDLVIENLPTLNDQLLCEFTFLNRSLITNATRRPYGVNCTTPQIDTLPPIPAGQHNFTAKLSVRTTQGPDLVTTNFTFYDCSTYSSCTQCVSSSSPCDWCVDGHRCTHDTAENCRNDILVTGVSRIGPSYRSGPRFCPTIESTSDGTNEILVPSGVKKAIKVKVRVIGQFIVQTRFVCQFNIEGQVTSVNAQLLADNIYCDAVEFTYTSQAPNITVSFAVIWGGSKALDNPNNTHVLIYRCNDMANDCGKCLVLPEKFGCGWCSLDNKCSLRSDCKDETKDPLWISYNSERCPSTIIQVTPNKIQRTTAKTLDLVIENLPTLNDQLLCEFTFLNRSLITNATRRPYGVNCTTPQIDTLPPIPAGQHNFTAKLSVRTTQGPDLVTTNFTFYDCSTYSSCTQCVSSSSPCDWCVDGHRCTHDTAENCRNDILVTGVSRIGPSYRSGPRFCPTIESTSDGTNEILVPSGVKKAIKVKVRVIGQFIVQTRFVCQFNIEGQVTSVNAQLLADNIYCDAVEFTYTSQAPNITVSFAVIWGGSKALDNPNNTHVLIYRCNDMANDCGKCLVLPEKFGCGWCSLDNKCSLRSDCKDETKDPLWISYNSERCPSTIIQVTPNKIQRTTARTLDLVIENLPTLNDQLLCEFTFLNRSLITNATRRPYGVNCTTPRTDTLPPIPAGQHNFTAKLSVRTTQGPDLVTTNFTFYDCSTYSSCTQCVSSSSPCDWCVDGNRCTHDTAENCRNDILVTGVSRIGPSYRSGPRFCPIMCLPIV